MTDCAREYKYDNMRGFLILCVVFGHLLEIVPGSELTGVIYKVIYSFHIPALIFISGYFAKTLNLAKYIRKLVLPYFIFQILYMAFDHKIFNPSEDLVFQFTTPYWLLWYMLAMAVYYMLVQFIDRDNNVVLQVVVAMLVSLVVGYERSVGYYLS